jgi:hypothetical protein
VDGIDDDDIREVEADAAANEDDDDAAKEDTDGG